MTPPPEDITREAAELLAESLIAIYGCALSRVRGESEHRRVRAGAHPGEETSRLFTAAIHEAIRQAVEQERAQHEQVLASVRRFLALSSQFDRWIIEADRSWLRAFHEAEKAVGR